MPSYSMYFFPLCIAFRKCVSHKGPRDCCLHINMNLENAKTSGFYTWSNVHRSILQKLARKKFMLSQKMLFQLDTLAISSVWQTNLIYSDLFIQFFTTEPYACEPSSLPKYPPSKEMDVKLRDEEARRFCFFLRPYNFVDRFWTCSG